MKQTLLSKIHQDCHQLIPAGSSDHDQIKAFCFDKKTNQLFLSPGGGTIEIWAYNPKTELLALKSSEKLQNIIDISNICYSSKHNILFLSCYEFLAFWRIGETEESKKIFKQTDKPSSVDCVYSESINAVFYTNKSGGLTAYHITEGTKDTRFLQADRPKEVKNDNGVDEGFGRGGYRGGGGFGRDEGGSLCLAVVESSKMVVAGLSNGTIQFWKFDEAQMKNSQAIGGEEEGSKVVSITYCPESKRIVAGYSFGTVAILEPVDGTENFFKKMTFKTNENSRGGEEIFSTDYNFKINMVVVGGNESTYSLWKIDDQIETAKRADIRQIEGKFK